MLNFLIKDDGFIGNMEYLIKMILMNVRAFCFIE